MRRLLLSTWLFLSLASSRAPGALSDVTHQTMAEVVKIAQLIGAVQPRLDDTKLMEYGLGIYRASKRYDIDPFILVAITQQETGFREHLPEGAAGEIGLCQIRKAWLKHPQFRREFGPRTTQDLKKPAKSFMYAAWILRDLKSRGSTSRTLPYWSYYNAVKFENRFKYFLLVNRNIATLRKFTAATRAKLVEAAAPQPQPRPEAPVTPPPRPEASLPGASEPGTGTGAFVPQRAPSSKPKAAAIPSGRWISDAMDRLQQAKQPRRAVPENDTAPQPSGDRQASATATGAMLRAASGDLDPTGDASANRTIPD